MFSVAAIDGGVLVGDTVRWLTGDLELNPDPVAPGERFTLTATISNPSTTNSLSSAITLRLPEGIDPFAKSLLTGTSNCDRGTNAALCEPGETDSSSRTSLATRSVPEPGFVPMVLVGAALHGLRGARRRRSRRR